MQYPEVVELVYSQKDYNTAKSNQQTRWLAWQEGLTPVNSGMKKTIDNEQEF